MKPRTMVFISSPNTQCLVAEALDEVQTLWNAATERVMNDQAATVELTNVTGYFEPYPIVLNPLVITCLEQAQPLQIESSQWAFKKGWDDRCKEMEGGPAGFAS